MSKARKVDVMDKNGCGFQSQPTQYDTSSPKWWAEVGFFLLLLTSIIDIHVLS